MLYNINKKNIEYKYKIIEYKYKIIEYKNIILKCSARHTKPLIISSFLIYLILEKICLFLTFSIIFKTIGESLKVAYANLKSVYKLKKRMQISETRLIRTTFNPASRKHAFTNV